MAQKYTDINVYYSLKYLYVFAGCVAGIIIFYFFMGKSFFAFAISAARSLFRDTLSAVVRTRLAFFDTTPQGRIINRLVKDCEVLDMVLPRFMFLFLVFCSIVLGMVVTICVLNWPCVIVIVPCLIIYILTFLQFRSVTPSIRRVEATTRSNVFNDC